MAAITDSNSDQVEAVTLMMNALWGLGGGVLRMVSIHEI